MSAARLLALICLLAPWLLPGAEQVLLPGGVAFRGRLRRAEDLLILRDSRRDVYVAASLGGEPQTVADAATVVYTMNHGLRTDAAATPAPGTRVVAWGEFGPDGRGRATVHDPQRGRVEVPMAVVEIGPRVCTLRASRAPFHVDRPTVEMADTVWPMVLDATDPAEPADLARLARFCRQYGDAAGAFEVCRRLQRLEPWRQEWQQQLADLRAMLTAAPPRPAPAPPRWLTLLDDPEPETVAAAEALRARLADFFSRDALPHADPLVRELAAADWPLAAKLALIRAAAPTSELPGGHWRELALIEPLSRRPLRFHARLPVGASGPRPALVVLDPLGFEDAGAARAWERPADEHGIILLAFPVPEDAAALDLELLRGALRAACRRLPIDPDRVLVSGVDAGGDVALALANRWPGAFSGVLAVAAGAAIRRQPNLRGLPTALIMGREYPPSWRRHLRELGPLAEAGVPLIAMFYRDRGLDTHAPASEELLPFFLARPRRHAAAVARIGPGRKLWIELTAAADEGSVHAECADNRIDLRVEQTRQLRLLFSPELIDFDRPVTVRVNGREVWRQRPEFDWRFLLEQAHRDADRQQLYGNELLIHIQ